VDNAGHVVPKVPLGLRIRNFRGTLMVAFQDDALELSAT
jgi:hypothetical protein